MIYRLISRLYSKKIVENYSRLLNYANIRMDHQRFLGFITAFGFVLGWALAFWFGTLFKWNLWVAFGASFLGFEAVIYMWLSLSIDAKAKFVEKVLPDVLQLMASNMRAGLTPDRALLLASRPEFGPLNEEINRMGKEITTGKDIGEALKGMSRRIRSEKLEKTVNLISSGLKSGGELASLLENTAKNLRKQEFVDLKIKSSVGTYVIFIFAAVCIGAPLLYGLSSFLIEVLTKIISNVEIPDSSTMNLPLSISQVSLEPSFVTNYIIVTLLVTPILGSMIIGLIRKGDAKQGLKFAPLMIAIGLVIYFTVKFLISSMLSGLMGF